MVYVISDEVLITPDQKRMIEPTWRAERAAESSPSVRLASDPMR